MFLLGLAGLAPAGEAAAPPRFTQPPAVARGGGESIEIKFAVDRATDVTVCVLDGSNNVVRHLAAGVLGENAPAPFKKGALDQTIEWDGKDDHGEKVEEFKGSRVEGLKGSRVEEFN